MFKPFTSHLTSLHRKTKTILQTLIPNHKTRTTKQRLSSDIDTLTPSFASMEVSSQLKQVFKIIDANGDGKISSLELGQVLSCLGYHDKSVAFKEAEGMVREMDCNGDGVIDLDEFMGVVNSVAVVDGDDVHDGKEEHLRDAFLIFDADNNGLISAEELQRVLTNLGSSKCSLRECKKMIRAVDKNGDGFVDFKEFRLMMTIQS